jgi:hypothetical protein
MAKLAISDRHRPSKRNYFIHNFKTTFDIVEKAHVMVALGWIFVSAIVGLVTGLVVPFSWEYRLALGLALFIVIQFGVITPMQMWRNAVWVANIENLLTELCGCHDDGVKLLNSHVDALNKEPSMKNDDTKIKKFLADWGKEFDTWTEKTTTQIEKLYPLEARRFKNIVVYIKSFDDGFNDWHDRKRSMLLRRLEKLDAIMTRHQPSLLPER